MASNSDLWFAERGAVRKRLGNKLKVFMEDDRKLNPMVYRARNIGGKIISFAMMYGVVENLTGFARRVGRARDNKGRQGIASVSFSAEDIVLIRDETLLNRYVVARMDCYEKWPSYVDPIGNEDWRVLAYCQGRDEIDAEWRGLPYQFDPSLEDLKNRIVDARMFPIVGDIGRYSQKGVSRLGLSSIRFNILGSTFDFPLYEPDKRPVYHEMALYLADRLDFFCLNWEGLA